MRESLDSRGYNVAMERFVVLRHELPASSPRASHWDFMLEGGSGLRTWALEALPSEGEPTVAQALPEHRLDYLTYEGSVSGDRGRVWRWDEGRYVYLSNLVDECIVRVEGRKMHATWTLSRTVDDQRWVVLDGGD